MANLDMVVNIVTPMLGSLDSIVSMGFTLLIIQLHYKNCLPMKFLIILKISFQYNRETASLAEQSDIVSK